MVIDDGRTMLAIVVLDAIGLMNNEVIDIRDNIPPHAGVTYSIVVSTHNHEGPDLLGLWGKTPFKSGVEKGVYDGDKIVKPGTGKKAGYAGAERNGQSARRD